MFYVEFFYLPDQKWSTNDKLVILSKPLKMQMTDLICVIGKVAPHNLHLTDGSV